MAVSARALVPAFFALGMGTVLALSAVPAAAAPSTPPQLCTDQQERDADKAAVLDCFHARLLSAQARIDGIPLPDREKVSKYEYFPQMQSDIGVESPKRNAANKADLAAQVTCRFAAKEGGKFCIDWDDCVKTAAKQRESDTRCEIIAGGRPDGSVKDDDRSDDTLPTSLRKAKETADRASEAAVKAGTGLETVEQRIAANKAENEAVAAARVMKWVS